MAAPKQGLDMDSLISISEGAKLTPYTPDFIRQLARSHKITAVKIGRDWLTTPAAIRQYINNQQVRHTHALELLSSAERSLL